MHQETVNGCTVICLSDEADPTDSARPSARGHMWLSLECPLRLNHPSTESESLGLQALSATVFPVR